MMKTEKMHYIVHAPSDVAKWGDLINMSGEVVETNHKTFVKKQGKNTNQGESADSTMMKHCVRKRAAQQLCAGIQGTLSQRIKEFCVVFQLKTRIFRISA